MAKFDTTSWTIILQAKMDDTIDSAPALHQLCSSYWYPLYAYIRNHGYSPEDAEDLTQEYFLRFLEKDFLKDVDAAKGRFRSFLLASARHFLANHRCAVSAQRRGGRAQFVSIDFSHAEKRHSLEPADAGLSPDKLFDRAWALTLLSSALTRLEQEYENAEKLPLFKTLESMLHPDGPLPAYRELALTLAMSEGAVRIAVHRMRRRYRDLCREEVAQTLASGEDISRELDNLLEALRA